MVKISNIDSCFNGNASTQIISSQYLRVGANHSSYRHGLEKREDINVFIVSSGIFKHPDLNVVGGVNFTSSNREAWNDNIGTGTFVAGILGAKNNDFGIIGIAPGVRLWAVKVQDVGVLPTISALVQGLNWIYEGRGKRWCGHGIVCLLPITFEETLPLNALDLAINNLTDHGIVVCSPVESENRNLSYQNPSLVSNLIIVAPTERDPNFLTLRTNSDYGNIIDILAPGTDITSTYINGLYRIGRGPTESAAIVTGTIVLLVTHLKHYSKNLSDVLHIKRLLIKKSSEICPVNYDGTCGCNPRIYIPPNKQPTSNISVYAGSF